MVFYFMVIRETSKKQKFIIPKEQGMCRIEGVILARTRSLLKAIHARARPCVNAIALNCCVE